MGAPNTSKARLTISIARSTPAQKPRGLANTKLADVAIMESFTLEPPLQYEHQK